MPAFKLRHLMAVGAIVGSLSYLGIAGFRAGIVYYLTVDQVLTQPELQGGRVRVHGMVAEAGPLLAASGELASGKRLVLQGSTGTLAVDYAGTVPDGFAVGREVVVEGLLDQPAHLAADVLMTKCATKYQPEDVAGQGGG